MKKRFVLRLNGDLYSVLDTHTKKTIARCIPTKAIAEEIASDFEAMSKRDYRSIGGPDMSKNVN